MKDIPRTKKITTIIIGVIGIAISVFLMIMCFNIQNKAKNVSYLDSSKVISPTDIASQDETPYIVTIYYSAKELAKQSTDTDEITRIVSSSNAMLTMLKNVERDSDIKYYVLEYNTANKTTIAQLKPQTYTDYFVFNNNEFLYRSYGVKNASVLISEVEGTVEYGSPRIDLSSEFELNGLDTVTFTTCESLEDETSGFHIELTFSEIANYESPVIARSGFSEIVDDTKTKYVVVTYSNTYDENVSQYTLSVEKYSFENNILSVDSLDGSYKTIEIRIYPTNMYNQVVNDSETNKSDIYTSIIYKTWQ